MFKGNNKNTRTVSLIRSDVFMVNFEHILYLFLVFLLLIFNKEMLAGLFLINLKKSLHLNLSVYPGGMLLWKVPKWCKTIWDLMS